MSATVATLTSAQLATLALKVLEKAARDSKGDNAASMLPPGVYGAHSFALQVSCKGVTVEAPSTYTGTVAVPLTRVVGALSVEAETLVSNLMAAFQAVLCSEVAGVGSARAAELAEMALGVVCESSNPSPQAAAQSLCKAASKRAGSAADVAALEAAGDVWAECFKGGVEKKTRAGATKVLGGQASVAE